MKLRKINEGKQRLNNIRRSKKEKKAGRKQKKRKEGRNVK